MVRKFGKCVHDVLSHKTPGIPKFLIIRPTVKSKKISAEDQWDYWPRVGILLYLVKHSCPNLANATREPPKANSVNPVAYKKLLHAIKYVLGTKNLGIEIKPMGNSSDPLEIICFSHGDYVRCDVLTSNILGK